MDTVKTSEAVGFIGLGALGTPIALNLLAAGRALTVWNRTASKAVALIDKGAQLARTPGEAVPRGGVVFTILWDDASVEQVMQEAELLERLGPGGIHVAMTTVTPGLAKRLAALHEAHGSSYVEAPVFGLPQQAVARQLTICLGGATAAKERVRPLLEAMGGQRIFDFGEAAGVATATKLVGNFMLIAGFVAMQEAFDVLSQSGIDPKPTLEMLTSTVLASPGNQRFAGILLSGKPVPLSGIGVKDLGLFERFAESAHSTAPLARQVRAVLAATSR